jgi:ATP/maltotriose-dependent transcriptional regulator MalT
LALLRHVDEAQSLAGPLLDDIERGVSDDETGIPLLAMLLRAAVALDRRRAAQVLSAQLACVAHLPMNNVSSSICMCVARHLGDAARLVGDKASARAYYTQALEATTRIRFRPEMALSHLGLAEQMQEEGDDGRAVEHLDVAIPELRDMRMEPSLERALGLLEQATNRAPLVEGNTRVSHMLTGREREVAHLLAAGRSNREIADTLVISVHWNGD